jgi:hypothetical protein
MSVEVFKTNVVRPHDAETMIRILSALLPGKKINFGLDDCDHILRIESVDDKVNATLVRETIKRFNFHCEILIDWQFCNGKL